MAFIRVFASLRESIFSREDAKARRRKEVRVVNETVAKQDLSCFTRRNGTE
jgi:hypothetical protein